MHKLSDAILSWRVVAAKSSLANNRERRAHAQYTKRRFSYAFSVLQAHVARVALQTKWRVAAQQSEMRRAIDAFCEVMAAAEVNR